MIGLRRRLLLPGLATLAMLLLLLGLGTWQVQRLRWKQGILARINQAELSEPVPLADNPPPYARISVTGHLRQDLAAQFGAEVRDTRAGPELGTHLIVPLERHGALPVLIDRGWVPMNRRQPISQPEGDVTIVGFVHPADHGGAFSAPDDPATRQFYTLDPEAIGTAVGLPHVAPFTVVALGAPPGPPTRWPEPAQHLPRPPNDHLSYAITWYGLAVALVAIFVIWARKEPRT